ncbi:putative DNA-binding protein [Thiovulum sp. ES]|nr:putative DNA-binding protein [Thiovulum sp. ES]
MAVFEDEQAEANKPDTVEAGKVSVDVGEGEVVEMTDEQADYYNELGWSGSQGEYDILTAIQTDVIVYGLKLNKKDLKFMVRSISDRIAEAVLHNGEYRLGDLGRFDLMYNPERSGVSKLKKDEQGNPIETTWSKPEHYSMRFQASRSTKDWLAEKDIFESDKSK